MADGLTNKQRQFVVEYAVDCNATQAAIRAGDSKKTAARIGWQNVRKLDIKAAIDELLAKSAEEAGYTREMALSEFEEARIMAVDLDQPGSVVAAVKGKVGLFGLDAPQKKEITYHDADAEAAEEVDEILGRDDGGASSGAEGQGEQPDETSTAV